MEGSYSKTVGRHPVRAQQPTIYTRGRGGCGVSGGSGILQRDDRCQLSGSGTLRPLSPRPHSRHYVIKLAPHHPPRAQDRGIERKIARRTK